jgi:nitrogen fixation/metabolism regulation signal transduction histidine kinase
MEVFVLDVVVLVAVAVAVAVGVLDDSSVFRTFELFVKIEFVVVVVVVVGLGSSMIISTLKRTLRARNLSGDLYSHRNKLGLFMLWIKS